jgi:hypothetical protein
MRLYLLERPEAEPLVKRAGALVHMKHPEGEWLSRGKARSITARTTDEPIPRPCHFGRISIEARMISSVFSSTISTPISWPAGLNDLPALGLKAFL